MTEVDVLAREQLLEVGEPFLGLLDRLQAEFLRDDRQRLQAPEPVLLLVDVLGHLELDEVAHRGRDDVLVVLKVVAVLGDLAERAGEIGGHAGLLGDDKRLHDEGGSR